MPCPDLSFSSNISDLGRGGICPIGRYGARFFRLHSIGYRREHPRFVIVDLHTKGEFVALHAVEGRSDLDCDFYCRTT